MKFEDEFNGDNDYLLRCIDALLAMDKSGSLVPHGLGGHGRSLLSAAAARLEAAVLAASAPAAAVPEGWKLVPIEPTDAMREAGERERISHVGNINPVTTYAAMLNAAPVDAQDDTQRLNFTIDQGTTWYQRRSAVAIDAALQASQSPQDQVKP